jgi:hypothetical protein
MFQKKPKVENLMALSFQYLLRFYVLREMHMESTNSNNNSTAHVAELGSFSIKTT